MLHEIFLWLDAGSVFVIYGIAALVGKIMTNDLPHIQERLARLEERKNRKT